MGIYDDLIPAEGKQTQKKKTSESSISFKDLIGVGKYATPSFKDISSIFQQYKSTKVGKIMGLENFAKKYEEFRKTKVGGVVDYTLQGPEYVPGGFLKGAREASIEGVKTRREEAGLAPGEKEDISKLPEALGTWFKGGVKGIPAGIKDRTDLFRYIEDVEGIPEPLKYAMAIPVAFSIPALPISKISKLTGLSKVGSKALKALSEVGVPGGKYGSKLGDLFVYRYGQPEQYAKLAERALLEIGVGTEKALEITKPLRDLSVTEQKKVAEILKGGLAEPIKGNLLYHGTSVKNADKIVNEGLDLLKTSIKGGSGNKGFGISLSKKPEVAKLHATMGGRDLKRGAVIPFKLGENAKIFKTSDVPNKYLKAGHITANEMATYAKLHGFDGVDLAELELKGIIKGGRAGAKESEVLIFNSKILEMNIPQELKSIAEPIRKEFVELGAEAVKEGLLDEATYLTHIKTYFPTLYRKFEDTGKTLGFDTKPIRIGLDRFKVKQDAFGIIYQPSRITKSIVKKFTSEEARDAFIEGIVDKKFLKAGGKILKKFAPLSAETKKTLGEIETAGYPTAKGLSQLTQAVTRSKFFKTVSQNPEWTSKVAKEGYEQLPQSEKLGKLSGQYVLSPIANDIQQWIKTKQPIEKVLHKITAWWKFGKVVANPATVSRNAMSNVVLAHTIGDLSPTRVDIWTDALKGLVKHDKSYKEAKGIGLLGRTTFYDNEIKQMLGNMEDGQGFLQTMKRGADRLGKIYSGQEDWAKLAVFKYQRSIGKTIEESATIAEKALFDYGKVPPAIDAIRKSIIGIPFITFAYKATPALAQAFFEKPTRFANYQRFFKGIESLSDRKETEEEKAVLPDWMTGVDKKLLKLPLKDKYGRSQYLDLSYILPWFAYAGQRPLRHPIAATFIDLQQNKDYFGNEIYSEVDDLDEKISKIGKYIWLQFSPPMSPGGYSAQKLEDAIKGTPDYKGRTRDLPSTIFDVMLGIKTTPIDVSEQKFWRKQETKKKVNQVRQELKKFLKKKGVTKEERDEKRRRAKEKIKRFFEEGK